MDIKKLNINSKKINNNVNYLNVDYKELKKHLKAEKKKIKLQKKNGKILRKKMEKEINKQDKIKFNEIYNLMKEDVIIKYKEAFNDMKNNNYPRLELLVKIKVKDYENIGIIFEVMKKILHKEFKIPYSKIYYQRQFTKELNIKHYNFVIRL